MRVMVGTARRVRLCPPYKSFPITSEIIARGFFSVQFGGRPMTGRAKYGDKNMNRPIVISALASPNDVLPAQAAARPGPFITAKDGTRLFVQQWGQGRPIVFVSAWTLNSDFWGTHLQAMASAGFQAIAFDRRGHGRSDSPSCGYDADMLADDLAVVIESLDVQDIVLVSHSMGSGEVARYLTRHGSERVAKLVFVAPTTPYLVKTEDNPDAVPEEMLDGRLAAIAKNFPEWVRGNEAPFFTAETDSETRAWIKAMMLGVSVPVAVTFQQFAGKTDFRPDLKRIELPTLVLHGDQDASAPLPLTGAKTAGLIRGSKLIVYEHAPHALPLTHRDRFIADLTAFAAG
jgi:pimeloyl-ACP methyl ester carboxylesterase